MTLVAPAGRQLVMTYCTCSCGGASQSYNDKSVMWSLIGGCVGVRSPNLCLKIRFLVLISDKLNYADSVINKVTTMQKQREADT